MKVTTRKIILLMVIATIFTSAGQLLWKAGTNQIVDVLSIFNWAFILGCLAYVIGAVLLVVAFRKGELSILYPIIATSYVWVSLFSPMFFPADSMNVWKWVGVFIILFSVSLLGWKSSRTVKEAIHG